MKKWDYCLFSIDSVDSNDDDLHSINILINGKSIGTGFFNPYKISEEQIKNIKLIFKREFPSYDISSMFERRYLENGSYENEFYLGSFRYAFMRYLGNNGWELVNTISYEHPVKKEMTFKKIIES